MQSWTQEFCSFVLRQQVKAHMTKRAIKETVILMETKNNKELTNTRTEMLLYMESFAHLHHRSNFCFPDLIQSMKTN